MQIDGDIGRHVADGASSGLYAGGEVQPDRLMCVSSASSQTMRQQDDEVGECASAETRTTIDESIVGLCLPGEVWTAVGESVVEESFSVRTVHRQNDELRGLNHAGLLLEVGGASVETRTAVVESPVEYSDCASSEARIAVEESVIEYGVSEQTRTAVGESVAASCVSAAPRTATEESATEFGGSSASRDVLGGLPGEFSIGVSVSARTCSSYTKCRFGLTNVWVGLPATIIATDSNMVCIRGKSQGAIGLVDGWLPAGRLKMTESDSQ